VLRNNSAWCTRLVEQATAETTAPAAEILEKEIEATPATPVIDEPMLVKPWFDRLEVIEEPAEQVTLGPPPVFAEPGTTEDPAVLEGPVMILEGPMMIAEPVMTARPVLAAKPVTIAEAVMIAEPVKMSKPVTTAKPARIAEPVMIAEPPVIPEPMAIERPTALKEPVTIAVPLPEQMWTEAPPVPQIPSWEYQPLTRSCRSAGRRQLKQRPCSSKCGPRRRQFHKSRAGECQPLTRSCRSAGRKKLKRRSRRKQSRLSPPIPGTPGSRGWRRSSV